MANQGKNTGALLFTRCRRWNTNACPERKTAGMGLSVINRRNLYLLTDETVAALNSLCSRCRSFRKKIAAKGDE